MASSGHWLHGLESQVFKGRVLKYEIQKWLRSLSAEEVAHWRALVSGFMVWSLRYIKGRVLEYEIQKWQSRVGSLYSSGQWLRGLESQVFKGRVLEYEIQKWLSLSAEEVAHWRALGSGFMAWSLRYLRDSPKI